MKKQSAKKTGAKFITAPETSPYNRKLKGDKESIAPVKATYWDASRYEAEIDTLSHALTDHRATVDRLKVLERIQKSITLPPPEKDQIRGLAVGICVWDEDQVNDVRYREDFKDELSDTDLGEGLGETYFHEYLPEITQLLLDKVNREINTLTNKLNNFLNL